MATVFSNTVNYWRAFADYVTSLSSTHFTVTVTAFGVQAQGYGFDISSGITTTIWDTAGGACASASGGMHSSYGGYATGRVRTRTPTPAGTARTM